jgi:hypothetical protein
MYEAVTTSLNNCDLLLQVHPLTFKLKEKNHGKEERERGFVW